MASNSDDISDDFREQLKQKSTDELIQLALRMCDDENDMLGWNAIGVLHYRTTREVFEAAKSLCESHDPAKQAVGIDIMAQLGFPTRTYLDETLNIFFNFIETSQNSLVLHSVGVGLGHISHEPRKIMPLLKLKNHPDSEVRFGVVFGLCCEEDPLAIQALIELSSDEDAQVRDWATFGLGSQINVDTSQIREALFERAIDTKDDSDAPAEAMVGLARRDDERAFELKLNYLQAGNIGTLVLEAVEILADPRFIPTLTKLRDTPSYHDYEKSALEDAITACKG